MFIIKRTGLRNQNVGPNSQQKKVARKVPKKKTVHTNATEMQNREPPFLQNEWGIFYSFLSSFSFLVLSKAENGTFCFLKWTKKKNAGKKALFLQRFSIYCEKQQIGKRNTKIFFFSAVSTYLPHTRTYAGFFHSSHRGLYIDKHTHNEHLQGFQTGSSKIG